MICNSIYAQIMSNNLFSNNKLYSTNMTAKTTFMLNSNKAHLCDGLSFSVMWAIAPIVFGRAVLGSSVLTTPLTGVRCISGCTGSFSNLDRCSSNSCAWDLAAVHTLGACLLQKHCRLLLLLPSSGGSHIRMSDAVIQTP